MLALVHWYLKQRLVVMVNVVLVIVPRSTSILPRAAMIMT